MVLLARRWARSSKLIERMGTAPAREAFLTDVGSTKAEVLARATSTFGKDTAADFLAGHPMAGKEQAGVEGADPESFPGSRMVRNSGPPNRRFLKD